MSADWKPEPHEPIEVDPVEYQDWLEEGDCCPICAERGIDSRVMRKQDPCTCFVMAPCSACVNGWLECVTCGFEHHPDETLTQSIENYGGYQ